jgi:hypothetical protein
MTKPSELPAQLGFVIIPTPVADPTKAALCAPSVACAGTAVNGKSREIKTMG